MLEDIDLRAQTIVAKHRTFGASCCTSGCIPERVVLEMVREALDSATPNDGSHEVMVGALNRLYLAQKELAEARRQLEYGGLELRQTRQALDELRKAWEDTRKEQHEEWVMDQNQIASLKSMLFDAQETVRKLSAYGHGCYANKEEG